MISPTVSEKWITIFNCFKFHQEKKHIVEAEEGGSEESIFHRENGGTLGMEGP